MNKRKAADTEGSSSNFIKRAKSPVEEPLRENVMRYYLMPSLTHLSAVKIIIVLWNQKHIKDKIMKMCMKRSKVHSICKLRNRFLLYPNLNTVCKDIEKEISDTVLKLSELDGIVKILSYLVNPVGQEIFDWIDYHEKYVFCIIDILYEEVGANYLDCLVWTTRGTIDYKETAKALLTKLQFYVNKFFLACTYCLEDDIAITTKQINDEKFHLNSLSCKRKPMVYFWGAQMTGDFTILNREVFSYNKKYKTNYSVNECIFRKLVSEHGDNQIAIKFMWNKLSDDEKTRQILSVMKYSKADLKCFFLSRIGESEQQKAFRAKSRNMLLCLLDDWLWKDYFMPTLRHVWNIIPGLDFLRVVHDIVICMEKCDEKVDEYNRYKAILKEVWHSAPKHLKEFMFDFQNRYRVGGIFFALLCKRNIDAIVLMLHEMNETQRKAMVLSSHSNYRKCYWLIINDQIDIVKIFIDNTLVSEIHVATFKRMFIEHYGCKTAEHFIKNQERDKLEEFMQWVFISDNDKNEFKAKLAYGKVCDDILESILADNNGKDFMELENFFQWCASGNTQKVSELKWGMYEVYFTKVVCTLIKEEKYQLLEQFLHWCFQNNERQVEQVKCNFYGHRNYIQIIELVQKLIEKNDHLRSLEKFVRWCFAKNSNINRFKKWILEAGSEDTVGVCIELLYEGMFILADEFVCWCCNSSQMKIRKFKNELMLCNNIKYLFTRYSKNNDKLEKIKKWFNPCSKTFVQFRKKFSDFNWLEDADSAVLT